MRNEAVQKAIEKLRLRHEHIVDYGEGNEYRLIDHHEVAYINTFSWLQIEKRKQKFTTWVVVLC